MSAPVLGHKGQKKSLLGKDAKAKRKEKSILWLLDDLDQKVTRKLDSKPLSKVTSMLKTVLPSAHIYKYQSRKFKKNEAEKEADEEKWALAKFKRNQFLFGANVVSKGLRAGTVACVLFAHDITPELLKRQLQRLCKANKVPFLNIPKLRAITQKSLGFPCIVVGFKKDSIDFQDAIKLVTSIYKTLDEDDGQTDGNGQTDENHGQNDENHGKNDENDGQNDENHGKNDENDGQNDENDDENGESDEDDKSDYQDYENCTEEERALITKRKSDKIHKIDIFKKDKPFKYLVRSSINGPRACIPEEYMNILPEPVSEPASVSVPPPEPTLEAGTKQDPEISFELSDKRRKIGNDSRSKDEGQEFSFEYTVAKILKIHGDPGRARKKFKKFKKIQKVEKIEELEKPENAKEIKKLDTNEKKSGVGKACKK